jgi:K+-sensing histidine kinase KdpD
LLVGLPFLTFAPAIIITAVIAGWRPAAGVLVLSLVAAWYLWLIPAQSFAIAGPGIPIALIGFAASGALMITLVEGFRVLLRVNAAQQERLSNLVRQQETMFREMQHRVANNMQFIASLLGDAGRRIRRGEEAQQILDQAVLRIASMANTSVEFPKR